MAQSRRSARASQSPTRKALERGSPTNPMPRVCHVCGDTYYRSGWCANWPRCPRRSWRQRYQRYGGETLLEAQRRWLRIQRTSEARRRWKMIRVMVIAFLLERLLVRLLGKIRIRRRRAGEIVVVHTVVHRALHAGSNSYQLRGARYGARCSISTILPNSTQL